MRENDTTVPHSFEKDNSQCNGITFSEKYFINLIHSFCRKVICLAFARRNTGSYAEYLVCEDANVFPLHPRLSFAQGAALGTPYFTAYKALIMGAQVMV